jgi:hypothetical protein
MRRDRKLVYVLTFLVFVGYAIWMLGPYLRSVIVRDATVTTWSRAAIAPIAGTIVTDLPAVGSVIGEDGHVATIRNPLLLEESRAVEDTRDRVIQSQSRIQETREYLADLEEMKRERVAALKRHAEVFHAQLEDEIASLRRDIDVNSQRIAVLQRVADRQRELVDRGVGSEAALDEALLRMSELEAVKAKLEASLSFARLRDRSAEDGVFIMADGNTPDWLRYGELELRLEKRRTRHELHAADADLKEASRDLKMEEATLATLGEASVKAPPGSLVFSVVAAPAATVAVGERIIEWIDCSTLLVDVPVSDAELPLIRQGAAAKVVLEGESQTRDAVVLLARGSSATLGRADIAAIAKGRTAGVAEVLLTLDSDAAAFERCPVGRAAYVEFPDVGLLDILRARLRL